MTVQTAVEKRCFVLPERPTGRIDRDTFECRPGQRAAAAGAPAASGLPSSGEIGGLVADGRLKPLVVKIAH